MSKRKAKKAKTLTRKSGYPKTKIKIHEVRFLDALIVFVSYEDDEFVIRFKKPFRYFFLKTVAYQQNIKKESCKKANRIFLGFNIQDVEKLARLLKFYCKKQEQEKNIRTHKLKKVYKYWQQDMKKGGDYFRDIKCNDIINLGQELGKESGIWQVLNSVYNCDGTKDEETLIMLGSPDTTITFEKRKLYKHRNLR